MFQCLVRWGEEEREGDVGMDIEESRRRCLECGADLQQRVKSYWQPCEMCLEVAEINSCDQQSVNKKL